MLLDALIWAQHRWYLLAVYGFLAWLFWHVLWPYLPTHKKRRSRKEND